MYDMLHQTWSIMWDMGLEARLNYVEIEKEVSRWDTMCETLDLKWNMELYILVLGSLVSHTIWDMGYNVKHIDPDLVYWSHVLVLYGWLLYITLLKLVTAERCTLFWGALQWFKPLCPVSVRLKVPLVMLWITSVVICCVAEGRMCVCVRVGEKLSRWSHLLVLSQWKPCPYQFRTSLWLIVGSDLLCGWRENACVWE